jgi:hypothetical protein
MSGASGCFYASDLMITSTPEGHFVHWRSMKLSNLLWQNRSNYSGSSALLIAVQLQSA